MRARVLLLIVISGLTFFAGLGRPAIGDSDEAYYAEAGREMVESGDWLTPHYNYEFRFQKPILFYWLVAGTYKVAGVSAGAARFWAAVSGLGLVLLTFAAARRAYDLDTAFLAGVITGTSLGYFGTARMSLPDLPLAFFITLSTWAGLEALRRSEIGDQGPGAGAADTASRSEDLPRTALPAPLLQPQFLWLVSGAAAGLAFLTKGPVGIVLPAIVIVSVAGIGWRRVRIRARDLLLAAAVFAAIGLPWYVQMWRVHGDAYLQSFFVGDNLERFATARFNSPRSLFFYVPVVLAGMLPWSPFLLLLVPPAAAVLARRRRLSATEIRLLAWAGLPLLLFTISVGKQPRYVLPVMPPLAIFVARALRRRLAPPNPVGQGYPPPRAASRSALGRGLAAVRQMIPRAKAGSPALRGDWQVRAWGTLSGFLVIALGAAIYLLRPLLPGTPASLVVNGARLVWLAGAAVIAVAWSPAWRRLLPALTAASIVMLLGAQYIIFSSGGPEPVEQAASIVRANLRAGDSWTTYDTPPDGGAFVRSLVFYVGRREAGPYGESEMVEVLRSRPLVFAAVAGQLPRLEERSGVKVRRLGEVLYFNTAVLTPGRLLNPDPSRDLITVVIATNR